MLNTADASRAIDSGARYLVTPTMNLDVIGLAVQQQVAIFPGGFSPTELAAGWQAGATAVKIFPAQTVGAGYLKHLRGPFPDLQAVPSGGYRPGRHQAVARRRSGRGQHRRPAARGCPGRR